MLGIGYLRTFRGVELPFIGPLTASWLIFVLACAVSWLLYLHRYAWGVIKPILQRENPLLTDTDLVEMRDVRAACDDWIMQALARKTPTALGY